MFLLAFFRGLAAHLDPLVFLFLLGLAGLFRLLASKSQKPDQTDEPSASTPQLRPELPRREVEDNDEERIRRFLEALGQPPSAEPPPPVTPRPVITFPQSPRIERRRTVRPRPNLLNPLPPLKTVPKEAKPPPLPVEAFPSPDAPPVEIAPPSVPVYAVEPVSPEATTPPVSRLRPVEAYTVASQNRAAAVAADLGINFAAVADLRRAILLREILGPPRALQPLEL